MVREERAAAASQLAVRHQQALAMPRMGFHSWRRAAFQRRAEGARIARTARAARLATRGAWAWRQWLGLRRKLRRSRRPRLLGGMRRWQRAQRRRSDEARCMAEHALALTSPHPLARAGLRRGWRAWRRWVATDVSLRWPAWRRLCQRVALRLRRQRLQRCLARWLRVNTRALWASVAATATARAFFEASGRHAFLMMRSAASERTHRRLMAARARSVAERAAVVGAVRRWRRRHLLRRGSAAGGARHRLHAALRLWCVAVCVRGERRGGRGGASRHRMEAVAAAAGRLRAERAAAAARAEAARAEAARAERRLQVASHREAPPRTVRIQPWALGGSPRELASGEQASAPSKYLAGVVALRYADGLRASVGQEAPAQLPLQPMQPMQLLQRAELPKRRAEPMRSDEEAPARRYVRWQDGGGSARRVSEGAPRRASAPLAPLGEAEVRARRAVQPRW